MEYRCETPVLLLFFNRPLHAQAVLDRLRQVQPTRVYVHCDGPRATTPGEVENVAAVRAVVKSIDWECNVYTLFREQNMGLRDGVSGALDWFFNAEEMGIVVEDDCMPDLTFFKFCEDMLHHYRDNSKIMHIAGYNPANRFTQHNIGSYFCSKFVFVWGWASWRRAWQKMRLSLDGLEDFVAKKGMDTLTSDLRARTYLREKFEVTQQRKNNSWAYAWFYSILNANGLAILPSKNLVQNTGIGDANATNTNSSSDHAAVPVFAMKFPLIHPGALHHEPKLDSQLFYHSQKSRWRLWLWYFLKKTGLR